MSSLVGPDVYGVIEKETHTMNITFYLALLALAIAGSVLMTYYEDVRDRRFSKKKRKKKMKVA